MSLCETFFSGVREHFLSAEEIEDKTFPWMAKEVPNDEYGNAKFYLNEAWKFFGGGK